MRSSDAKTRDETTALLRDAPPKTKTKTTSRGARALVGLTLALCAAVGLAWTTATTYEDADANGPTIAAPRFWMTVDLGDGRDLSARAYARFIKQRLAEDESSEEELALGVGSGFGDETDANYDINDDDDDDDDEDYEIDEKRMKYDETSPEMQTLLDRIAADEHVLARLAEAQLGGAVSNGADVYNAGKSTAGAATNSGTSFCWKDSYGRGVGKLPKSCPANKETIAGGLLCYDKCSKFGNDFKRKGYDCHQQCKSGWRDDGLLCYKFKSSYGRGVGRIPPLRCTEKACKKFFGKELCVCKKTKSECPADRGDKCIGLCYKPCRNGYGKVGCNICAMNCKEQGYANGIAPSCPKKMYLSPGLEKTSCAPDQDKDAGLCYKKCRDTYSGVGPVCWGQPPKKNGQKWVNCGMGAASDKGTCASTIMDQVVGPLEVAAFVASAGTSSTKEMGEKAALIKAQMKTDVKDKAGAYKKIWEAICAVVTAAKKASKKGATSAEKANDVLAMKQAAKKTLLPLIGMLDDSSSLASTIQTFTYCSGIDCFRGVAELLAIVDPTGLAGTAAAYAYPKCDKV